MMSRIVTNLNFIEFLLVIFSFLSIMYTICYSFLTNILVFFFIIFSFIILVVGRDLLDFIISFNYIYIILIFLLIDILINVNFLIYLLGLLFCVLMYGLFLLIVVRILHWYKSFVSILTPIYVFLILYFLLLLITYLLDLSVNFLSYNILKWSSLSEVFVIFYFLKYQFVWLSKVFWFRIAISGIVVMYIGLFIMFLGEHDPYFMKRGNQIVYWFFTEGDLDLVQYKSYLLSNFNMIRDIFSVTSHYSYDLEVIIKYSIPVVIILFINFLLLSFISVWMYEIFWCYYYFNFNHNLHWCIFIYISCFLIFLNLLLAFLSIFFMVQVLFFCIEAKFSYDFESPYGYMNLPIQCEEFDDKLYSLSTIMGSYTYRYYSLNKFHLLMLPQRLNIKPFSSVLVYSTYSRFNKNIYLHYYFLLQDLHSFLHSLSLNFIFLYVINVLNQIDNNVENSILIKIEFLLLIKISLIPINISNTTYIKSILFNIFNLYINFPSNNLICLSIISPIRFYSNSFGYLLNIKIGSFILLIKESHLELFNSLEFISLGFKYYIPTYSVKGLDLLNKRLFYLNNLYGFYNYIYKEVSILRYSKVYVSTSLRFRVKVIIVGLFSIKDYIYLNNLLSFYRRDFCYYDGNSQYLVTDTCFYIYITTHHSHSFLQ